MEIIYITIPVTLVFIAIGAGIFFWASKSGQFDDMDGPAHRILFDDDQPDNKGQTDDSTRKKESDDRPISANKSEQAEKPLNHE